MLFIFSKFKKRRWLRYNTNKRLRIYQALEKKFAKKQGREPLRVVLHPEDNWNCLGMFTVKNGEKRIVLNDDLLVDIKLRFHGMETILHEGRHAYQYEVVNRKLPWYAFRAKRWKKNWNGYIPSAQSSAAYNHQIIERDAQKYALKQMLKLDRKYRGDPDWERTIRINTNRIENADEQAKKEFGIFYKYKINRMINKNTENRYYDD